MKNKIPLLLFPIAMAMGAIQFVLPLCKRYAEAAFSNQSGGMINVYAIILTLIVAFFISWGTIFIYAKIKNKRVNK